jgi:hypothetical protein
MRTATALVLAATALAAAPAAAINYGTAQGTVLAGGERFELNHAYAVHRGGVFENGGGGDKTLTIVRLVDGEVPADAVADDKKFAKALADGKLHAVEIQLKDESGEILSQRLYHSGKTFDAPGGDDGTWLRGEYNNKVIWGALATDGVQPFGNEGFWRYEVFFAAQFQAPPAAALSENTASGTFKLGGKSAKLVAARAWVEPEAGSETTYTVLLLSSAPIDLATAKDDAKLLAAVKKQKLQAFKVKINDQEGTLAHQAWITPAGAEDMEPQEGLRWASWDFTTDSIVGYLTSEGDRQAGKTQWAVESHFNAAIAPAPAAE